MRSLREERWLAWLRDLRGYHQTSLHQYNVFEPGFTRLPGSGAVRRVNFGPFSENRVHHILHQKCEPDQVKEFEENS